MRSSPVNKYRAKKTVIDGITFDSKKEAARYCQLKILERAGQITGLVWDKKAMHYPLAVNGLKIGVYTPDFEYVDVLTGQKVTEDCKGICTRDYLLRKKLMKAIHGIEILET